MNELSFTAVLQQKIEERREGWSATRKAAASADMRFQARAEPLVAAISGLIEQLSSDPMFAAAMGQPKVIIKREDTTGFRGIVAVSGRVAELLFCIADRPEVSMRILPNYAVEQALKCGMSYMLESTKGDLTNIAEMMVHVRDQIAEFLADVYLSDAAHMLEPEQKRPRVFD